MRIDFNHILHPHIKTRHEDKECSKTSNACMGRSINDRLSLALTAGVGTMWCAYAFTILACVSLPSAIHGGIFSFVQWLSTVALQLILLSVILTGQNIQGQTSDKRAEMTYNDAEAVLHEAQQIQNHLKEQDAAINAILDRIEKDIPDSPDSDVPTPSE